MKKSVVALLHLGYWAVYVGLVAILVLAIDKGEDYLTLNLVRHFFLFSPLGVILFVPSIIGYYGFYVVLFPKYLSKKKLIALALSSILASVMAALIGDLFLYIKWKSLILFETGWESAIGITILLSIIAFVHGIFGLVIKGFVTAYSDITLKEDLNKKNYEMELALVKNQINPHFLFNTLNNIDVLIQKDAIKASEYLNKLSDIMRFMLYETKANKIELSKELTYIEKYIELQKIRSSNNTYVNYILEGNANNLLIEPMLFIPFIENAFKHTENKSLENAITVKISIHKEMIIFECDNKYNVSSKSNSEQNGLGKGLIEKRLQLLYPNNHTLEISEENNIYKVKLTLNNVH
jgi:two-component system LytT family sensor kinase